MCLCGAFDGGFLDDRGASTGCHFILSGVSLPSFWGSRRENRVLQLSQSDNQIT